MRPFEYVQAGDVATAVAESAGGSGNGSGSFGGTVKYVAGGTNIIDLMKEDVMRPVKLVDINALPLATIQETASGGMLLGALARNADTAYHPVVRTRFPLLTAAILAGASPQLRNMATNGGNLLQRTRCFYFYDVVAPCNKREPGTGCSAIGGLTRQHAILGASEQCIATHPSDMCVALAALGAGVHVTSDAGSRVIPLVDLHRLPGNRPDLDTNLSAGELITHLELPARQRLSPGTPPTSSSGTGPHTRSPWYPLRRRSISMTTAASNKPGSPSVGSRTSRGAAQKQRVCSSAGSQRRPISAGRPTRCWRAPSDKVTTTSRSAWPIGRPSGP